MAARPDVTPNRRGARSREIVLDAAERLMAEHGYEAATLAAIVKEAGIPMSSVYHYYGSKDGILLAVMERGAARFFAALPDVTERVGDPLEHLQTLVTITRVALEERPDFLRLLVTLAAQPPAGDEQQVHAVVNRVRDQALDQLRRQLALALGRRPSSKAADRLARFALASFDGAFVAHQADPRVALADVLDLLPAALLAIHETLR